MFTSNLILSTLVVTVVLSLRTSIVFEQGGIFIVPQDHGLIWRTAPFSDLIVYDQQTYSNPDPQARG